MVTAVRMQPDEAQRHRGMDTLSDLLDEGGLVIMSLLHGPIPTGRRMFLQPCRPKNADFVSSVFRALPEKLNTVLRISA